MPEHHLGTVLGETIHRRCPMGQTVLITVLIAVVAVTVAIVPIILMLRSEHRHLHGSARHWIRRNGRGPSSVYEIPRMYNQTTDEEQQELV